MKNFTNNFKQFTSRLSARWLIMALMMLVGTSSAWAATPGTLYLGLNDNWKNNTTRFSAYFFGNGDKWVSMKKVDDYTYSVAVPSGYTKVIFCAMNKNNTTNDWNNKWNQTGDLTIPTDGKNKFTLPAGSWDGATTTWSTYCNVSVSVSKSPDQSVYLTGETVTLTATTANETSFAWKEGSTQVSTNKIYDYTTNTVGSVTLKAVATASCGSNEEEVTLSFVNQKKIVVKCKGADNIHLYTWNGTNNDGTITWPGTTTSKKDGDYYVWEISTETPINILFNKGGDNPKTKDINGLQVGYEYVFTWSGSHDASISLPTPTALPKPCTKPDKPSITLSHSSICSGDNTEVTITVTGEAEEYALYVVNNGYTKQGNSQESKTFTKTPSATTTYAVKAFNGTCESDFSESKTVTVSEKPSITLNPTSKTICKGEQLDLSKFASSSVDLTWWNGQTQITAPVFPEANTTYTVKAINGACTVTKDFPVTVNELPSAPALTNDNASACETASGTVNLNTLASPVGTVNWYDSSSQLISNATVSIATVDIFTYTAKAVSNGCESKNGTTFTLKVKANASASNYAIKSGSESKVYTGSALGLTSDEIVVSNNAGAVESIYFKQGNNTVTPQNVGEYEVYVTTAATNDICAGDIKIGTFVVSCKTPSITMTVTEVTYNGSAQKPNVTIEGGATPTLKYGVNTYANGPTNAGTYAVTVSASLNGNYCALTDASAGNFIINKKQPAKEDFTYTATAVYSGSGIGANVTLKSPYSGAGRIHTYYKTSTTDYTETLPINAGEYTVAISLDEGDNFSESREKLVLGTFTITCPTPAQPQLAISDKVKVCEGKPNTDGNITISNFNSYTDCNFYLGSVSNENKITSNTVAVNNAGTYTIIVENACGESSQSSIEIGADVLTPALTDITIESSAALVCAGDNNVTLTCNLVGAIGTPTYKWTKNGEPVGDNSNTIQAGVLERNTPFSVSVILDNSGCTKEFTASKELEVKVRPGAPNLGSTGETICYGTLVNLPMVDNNDANNQINWYNGKLVKPTNVSVLENTTFYAEAVSENGLGCASADRTEYTVIVNPLPIISLPEVNDVQNVGQEITLTATGSNYTSLEWSATGGTRDMYCYAWTGSNTEKLGAWPGENTKNGDYTYNGTKYAYWKIEGDLVNVIFNNGSGTKTGDIEGLEKGKRYVFTISTDYKTVTKTVDGEAIYMPEVETTSITPVRNGNTTNVTLVGRVKKRGCANLVWYGFQYKGVDDKDFTNEIKFGTNDLELGATFTKTQSFENGTYIFRAKIVNSNGSKAYGEELRVTVAERDLTIAAIHDDEDVDTGTYYDFVGLYMSSISKPTSVEIVSYTWYKDGSVYNPTYTASTTYGETYINTNGSNNIRPNETGTYKLVVTLSNNTTLESNEITIEQASAVSASSILTASNRTLPVISVRTNKNFPSCDGNSYPSAQADKLKKKRSVDVKIFDKDGNLYYDRKARMNYRGSSSLNFVKKSYAFCPGGDMCGSVKDGLDYVITEKVDMFGLGSKEKDWVLYAAAADPSMMRNRIVFDTYKEMTEKWGVNSMYVELVVDGEYKGVYVFMDKITKNRVGVDNAAGFIVKFDKTDAEDRFVDGSQDESDEKTFTTTRTGRKDIYTYGTTVDQMFEIEYPEKDDNKANWSNIVASIQKRFEDFETALADGDFAKVRTIIDYKSWADWFIISEYIKNQDAYRASCIFVYNGDKIEARPLWDQELSMNNTCRTSNNCGITSNLLIETESIYTDCFPAPFWFTGKNAQFGSCGGNDGSSTLDTAYSNYLLKDGCFISMIKERWATHIAESAPLHSATLKALFDKFDGELTAKKGSSELNTAQKREAKYWDGKTRSTAACGNGGTGYGDTSYSTEKGNIEGWIDGDREEILGGLIHDMEGNEISGGISITMNPANGTVTPWMPVKVTVNVEDGTKYTYDDKSITTGITEDTDKAIVSNTGDVYTYTFPRPEAWGTGNNNGNTKETRSYIINAALVDQSTECPGLPTEAIVQVKLADEGDDNCTE